MFKLPRYMLIGMIFFILNCNSYDKKEGLGKEQQAITINNTYYGYSLGSASFSTLLSKDALFSNWKAILKDLCPKHEYIGLSATNSCPKIKRTFGTNRSNWHVEQLFGSNIPLALRKYCIYTNTRNNPDHQIVDISPLRNLVSNGSLLELESSCFVKSFLEAKIPTTFNGIGSERWNPINTFETSFAKNTGSFALPMRRSRRVSSPKIKLAIIDTKEFTKAGIFPSVHSFAIESILKKVLPKKRY